jgi:hypothetical protein
VVISANFGSLMLMAEGRPGDRRGSVAGEPKALWERHTQARRPVQRMVD